LRFFGVRAYSGELFLRGFYRSMDEHSENINEHQQSLYYSGGIRMNASAYLLHPNFCQLELGAGFMPESSSDKYLVSPDFSEVRSVKNFNILSSFFSTKKVSFIASASYDEAFSKRENMTDIKSTNKYVGGTLTYSNKVIPVSFNFYKWKFNQEEIQTGRKLYRDQTQFEVKADQSFSANDRQKLVYSHKISSTLNENSYFTSNIFDDVNFNSLIEVGRKKIFTFNTTIANLNQYGSFSLNRFQAMEDLLIKLPLSFSFRTNYNYYYTKQPYGNVSQHSSMNYLDHQLYRSLHSRFFFEYTSTSQSVYNEYYSKTGFDFNYTKKIPWGHLNLSYGYFRYHMKYSGIPANLNVVAEEYQLSDGKIVLLRRPYIDKQTILVKDVTGTIIYQPGLDYILIDHGNYLEIRRIPSGQILKDGLVYLDYVAKLPNSYTYDANNHMASASVSFLKDRLDIYYRFALQDYSHLEYTDLVTLNYYTQNIVGFRLGFENLGGGIEYESYSSSIVPYRLIRYYLMLQKSFRNKLMLSINGNMQNYTMLNEPLARVQRYIDLTGRVEYLLFGRTKLSLDVMYRKQQGYQIDLDLLTGKLELTSIFFQLYLTAGVEVYKRYYVGDRINFKGTYIQISRRF
jgi:hypothetical protein